MFSPDGRGRVAILGTPFLPSETPPRFASAGVCETTSSVDESFFTFRLRKAIKYYQQSLVIAKESNNLPNQGQVTHECLSFAVFPC